MRSEGYSSCLVCVSVCLSAHAILAVRAIKSTCTCITKDTIVLSVRFAAIIKWRVFLIIRVFYLPRQGRPSLVDAYSACNVSCTVTCLLIINYIRVKQLRLIIIPD